MSEQPPTYQSGTPMPQAQGGSGLAVAALVLGIIALVLFCAWYISIPAAVIAIVLGAIARGKANRGEAGGKGMATAGIICSVIAIVLAVLLVVGALAIFGLAKRHGVDLQKAVEQRMQQPTSQPSLERSKTPASHRSMLPTAVWPA